MRYGIRLLHLAGRALATTPLDGRWLADYDPTRPGTDPGGRPMTAHIVTTADPAAALAFPDVGAAHACWTKESGLPYPRNAPLTAWTISVEPLPEPPEPKTFTWYCRYANGTTAARRSN
jgi:hypothetical protein